MTGRFGDLDAAGVGFADDLPAANAAAGQRHVERPRVVVAAGAGVDPRRAAEFAHPDHERPVEHAALLEVGDELRHRLVDQSRCARQRD